MNLPEGIQDVQLQLKELGMDGWLLYDFCGSNDLARAFLGIPAARHLTRRLLYWIPAHGEPVQIVHLIESQALAHLPGIKRTYLKWQTLEMDLAHLLKGCKTVAMEYSPRNAIPSVSKVDGGMLDLVREQGVEVVSSAPFLQRYTATWDDEQIRMHLVAAHFLDILVSQAWGWVAERVKGGQPTTECDLQHFLGDQMQQHGFVSDALPIVAVNVHTADPHYAPDKESAFPIQKGDFLLVDIWCKARDERAVYADITRVAVMDSQPTVRQQDLFALVRRAQIVTTEWIAHRMASGKMVLGHEADAVCRRVIVDAGYGEFFTHRTGHNIHTRPHGPGANLDSLETFDIRPLIPRTCVSVEPGIYIPGDFGVRLEHDLLLCEGGKVQITGGVQDGIVTLL